MRILWVSMAFAATLAADPALTVYNQNFAIVRETVPLDLKTGVNSIEFTGVTSQLEPESVLLRDPQNGQNILILEQSYRADPCPLKHCCSKTKARSSTSRFATATALRSYAARLSVLETYLEIRSNLASAMLLPRNACPLHYLSLKLMASCASICRERLSSLFLRGRRNTIEARAYLATTKQSRWTCRRRAFFIPHVASTGPPTTTLCKGQTCARCRRLGDADNSSGKRFDNANVKLMAGDVRKF